MKDMTVSKALKWIFIAQILTILAFIPVVGAILAIIGFVMNLLALYGASKLNNGYHNAFVLSIVGIVLSIISLFAKGIFGSLISIISTVVSLGIIYFVINTTNGLLKGKGAAEIVKKGESVWKLNLICTVASVVLSIIAIIAPALAGVLLIIVGIVEIVAYILYLIYLYKSYNAL